MYDDNNKVTQMSLFDRFDNVVVNPAAAKNNELAIAADDLIFCEEIQQELNAAIENAREFQALFEAFQNTRKPEKLEHLKTVFYVPAEDFKEKIENLKKIFIGQLFRYFADKYYLKEIDLTHLAEEKNLDYKMVVDRILSEYGDLIDYSESRLKKDFKNSFCTIWASEPDLVPQLKNNRVIIPHMFWYDVTWDGHKFLPHNQQKALDLFIRAISYFETGNNQPLKIDLSLTYNNPADFSKPYELDLNKIKAVKLFKNSRVDLIFDSAESAREFFHMFDMANPIDNRR